MPNGIFIELAVNSFINNSMKKTFLIFKLAAIVNVALFANNISVSSVSILDINTEQDFAYVQFNLSWENSWHDEINHDAAWIFIKYQVDAGEWNHAYISLNNSDHSVLNDGGISASFEVGPTSINGNDRGVGAFIFRSGIYETGGSNNWQNVRIRWNYGENGVADNANITVKVFAIEMVYIPEGDFYVGDGTTTNIQGQLHDASDATMPLLITSENQITLGGSSPGSIGNNNAGGMNQTYWDDFNSGTTTDLPAAFPKGHNAFYIMKYEVTQNQYVDYLNTLTYAQQVNRTSTSPDAIAGEPALEHYTVSGWGLNNRNGIVISVPGINPSQPAVYTHDYNYNGTFNQSNDGHHIPVNLVTWLDAASYADWAGLRAITELEFEKACRGDQSPVPNEYAWGTTGIQNNVNYNFTLGGAPGERASSGYSIADGIGNALHNGTGGSLPGPHRAGAFAGAPENTIDFKIRSGASYYGGMEMSGNVWEIFVTIGNVAGRSYTGVHGDGSIDNLGNATVDYWPGINGNDNDGVANEVYGGSIGVTSEIGMGFRGGGIGSTPVSNIRVSSREWAVVHQPLRHRDDGFRLGRTAQ
jgi:formylglycine-generating enzyme required for sulfatase activity